MENIASNNTIWYLLAGLALVYLSIRYMNKKVSKRRKSREFLEGRRKHDKKD